MQASFPAFRYLSREPRERERERESESESKSEEGRREGGKGNRHCHLPLPIGTIGYAMEGEREREMKDGKVLKRMGWHMEVFMMVDRTGMLVLSKVKIELKNL